MNIRKKTLKNFVIAILSVSLIFLSLIPRICTAEPVVRLEYNWVNKDFDSTSLKDYDFSKLPANTLNMVIDDFKKNPYTVKLDAHGVENKFSDIEIEMAFASCEGNKIYLLFSIVWVSDIYVVYELDDFEIRSKYTTSAWSIKKKNAHKIY